VREAPGHYDALRDSPAIDACAELRFEIAPTGQDQTQLGVRSREVRDRLDEVLEPLFSDEPSDGEHDGGALGYSVGTADAGAGLGVGTEPIGIDTVRNRFDVGGTRSQCDSA
jgi:hypothetical protein